MAKKKRTKIILTGGGTGGPVTPLLAIYEEMVENSKKVIDFLWIGTKNGPERKMVAEVGIRFKTISNGKLRRYFSLENFIDIFRIILGFFEGCIIILKEKPDLVISAGGFVSVPFIWASWLLGVKVLIHQQDIRPGLANKLMAPFANKITVTFEKSLLDYGKKAVWTGNPLRRSLTHSMERKTHNEFDFENDLPVVLIFGGGTGATGINSLVSESLEELVKICNIIHVAGDGKRESGPKAPKRSSYKIFDFLEPSRMVVALKLADAIVGRAGLGSLTEFAFLEKPSIIIPMPDSHQEDNANIFKEAKAAIVLDQKKITNDEFLDNIKNILSDEVLRSMLRSNLGKVMKGRANENVVGVVDGLI